MALDLKGRQVEAFRDALLSAFPGKRDLEELVEFELSERLEQIVESGTLRAMALDLVRWARAHSRLDALLVGALRKNDSNQELRAFAVELSMSSDNAPSTELEALVVPQAGFENAAQWRARMERAERCICRIELADGSGGWRGVGTGSLVAADVVLTNHHVIDALGGAPARAQFDYALDAGGIERRGPAVALVPGALASSGPKQLDFALVRLADRIGEQRSAEGEPRGWLSPAAHAFAAGEPIFILQHPSADRLKLGVGVVSDVQVTPPRVRYTANTARGSSGSPCFSLGWDLVALHHAGETAVNRGIPLAAILEQLRASSQADLFGKSSHVFISYHRQGDEAALVERVKQRLLAAGHSVFVDVDMRIGTEWAKEISRNIARCDAFAVFLSEQSIGREMVQDEVRQAHQRRQNDGLPLMLPIRVRYGGALDHEMDRFLGHLQYAAWNSPTDDDQVLSHILRALGERRDPVPRTTAPEAIVAAPSTRTVAARPLPDMDPRVLSMPGGTAQLDDPLYVRRAGDMRAAQLARLHGATVVIRGARQQGKSSVLVRYLAACQERGKRIAFIDFQALDTRVIDDYAAFLKMLARMLTRSLGLKADITEVTDQTSFGIFIEDEVLARVAEPVVFAFDEVDRIAARGYKTDFYGMLRSWHNSRGNPVGANAPWRRVGLGLAVSTEPRLLITDPYQSPFNVGDRLELEGFTLDECSTLNQLCSDTLPTGDVERLHRLVGGHPYLTRLFFFHWMNGHAPPLDAATAATPYGPFGDHLRAMLSKLSATPDVLRALKTVIRNQPVDDVMVDRLRSVGLVRTEGNSTTVSNELYRAFFSTVQ